MRRIAPPDPPGLLGRERELAELATFVLRPPPHVRVVSFFITTRLAAQDTREAFSQVLLDQLAHMSAENLPAVMPEATWDAFLLDLLARATARCRDAGEQLVLVADGLDEDRNVSSGPGTHSVARLLPADSAPATHTQ